ncbi:hypothetical protein [Kaistella yonginensis]|uniref:hypothetical protein n=1 Tax=Kaistella yonginensis TaxID=658267 RepID=UPI0025B31002|nr:hypothetical protein [Kaistella yonginensis]MDN3607068.1 hypothetical protein [Kaistella yonginensis]
MKKFIILSVLMFSNLLLFSQIAYKMQVGDQLVYQVEAGNMEYDFIVMPTKLSATGVTFEYKMTEPINKTGTIAITADALKNSFAMYNRFSGGKIDLTNQTSVFASKKMMDAAEKGSADFLLKGVNSPAENFTTLEGDTSPKNNSTYIRWIKNINGTAYFLDGSIMENSDGSKAIRFTDGGGFPFITYMQLDFKIYLKEILRK